MVARGPQNGVRFLERESLLPVLHLRQDAHLHLARRVRLQPVVINCPPKHGAKGRNVRITNRLRRHGGEQGVFQRHRSAAM